MWHRLAKRVIQGHHEKMIRRHQSALLSGMLLLCLAANCGRLNHPAPADPRAVSGSFLSHENAGEGLRVATYNVHMEAAGTIVKAVEGNPNLKTADLLLFQEIEAHKSEGKTRAEQIAETLGMDFAYAPGYGLPDGGSHGVAILSRFRLRDVTIIELPYYHVVVNSARRVALAATISVNGQDLRIYSVHLDNRLNPAKRMRQLAPVFEAAADFPGPVIIAGDLNTSPFCWGVSLVPVPCGLQDNAVEKGARKNGFQTPVTGIGATAKWFSMRLDAIYTRGLNPKNGAVEHSVRLSDHLPLWLNVELLN